MSRLQLIVSPPPPGRHVLLTPAIGLLGLVVGVGVVAAAALLVLL